MFYNRHVNCGMYLAMISTISSLASGAHIEFIGGRIEYSEHSWTPTLCADNSSDMQSIVLL